MTPPRRRPHPVPVSSRRFLGPIVGETMRARGIGFTQTARLLDKHPESFYAAVRGFHKVDPEAEWVRGLAAILGKTVEELLEPEAEAVTA